MGEWVCHNGNLVQDVPEDFLKNNRAFRLGDGFFETVRVCNGDVFGWPAHYARIQSACLTLGIELHPVFSKEYMLKSLTKLLHSNGIENGGKLRLTCYREGKGAYLSTSNRMGFIAEANVHDHNHFLINDRGLSIDVYEDVQKHADQFSAFKTMGNFVSMKAAKWANEKKLSDALIRNYDNELIEATASNLFVVKNNAIYTPPISSGCVAGTFRMAVINAALDMRIAVYESSLNVNRLLSADEIFLTNAVSGIRWVGSFKAKRYYHKLSNKLIEHINQNQEVAVS